MEQRGPSPPPPGGPLWEIAGELRALLMLPAALTLQVAHPAVGAGVDDWSVFRTDPWGRAERSLRSLLTWVYGGDDALAEGQRLQRLHARINGVDAHGRPYRALDAETFAWVHTTGFPLYCYGMRYLGRRPYTAAEERRLYAEWLDVGRVLGVREDAMPQTVEEFWPVYRRRLSEEIEPTRVVRELTSLDYSVPPPDRGPRLLRAVLRPLWPWVVRPFARLRRFLTVGLLPPMERRALGLEWSDRDERRLRRLGRLVAVVVPLLPERLRYLPYARRARAAHRRRLRASR